MQTEQFSGIEHLLTHFRPMLYFTVKPKYVVRKYFTVKPKSKEICEKYRSKSVCPKSFIKISLFRWCFSYILLLQIN